MKNKTRALNSLISDITALKKRKIEERESEILAASRMRRRLENGSPQEGDSTDNWEFLVNMAAKLKLEEIELENITDMIQRKKDELR